MSDPLWQRVPVPLRFEGGALGLGLRIDTNSPALLDLATRAFGRFARPASGRIDFRMDVVIGGNRDMDESNGDYPADRIGRGVPVFHRERGSLYTAGDSHGSVVVADLSAGRAAAFVEAATRPEVIRTVLIESPVWRFAAYRGLVALHAAAVVIAGRTVVLRGAGGSGKSTLAYAAARSGHGLLAEEVTWFDPTGPTPTLRGAPWTVHLESDSVALFPEVADIAVTTRAGGPPKLAVDVAALSGNRCVEQASLGPIVFLEHRAGGAAPWNRLAALEAGARFDAGLLDAERTQRPDRLASARDVLVGHGAFNLRFSEPASALVALAEICGIV